MTVVNPFVSQGGLGIPALARRAARVFRSTKRKVYSMSATIPPSKSLRSREISIKSMKETRHSGLFIILLDPPEPECLALGGHADEVIQALLEEVGVAAGAVDEADSDPDVTRGEGLEMLPGVFIRLDGLEDVGRDDERPVVRDAVGLQNVAGDLALASSRRRSVFAWE